MAEVGSPCWILTLPEELLRLVIRQPVLEVPDLYRLGGVCVALRRTVNELWSTIARRRWLEWGEYEGKSGNIVWKVLCKERYCIEHKLDEALYQLSEECVGKPYVSETDIAKFLPGKLNKSLTELVLSRKVQQKHDSADLTHQHYGAFVYELVLRQSTLSELEACLSQPPDQQYLETGAALFAAYLNPYAGYTVESVCSTLDQLAEEVAECLLKQELQEMGRLGNLGEPPYLPHVNGVITDQTKICKAINTVLYTVHGFKGNAEDYYNIDNSLIHEVLKTKKGIPITLCIVYSSVARRLGVHLEPISFPQCFLLRMRMSDTSEDNVSGGYNPIDDPNRYIDAFRGGTIQTARSALEMIGGVQLFRMPNLAQCFNVATPVQVLSRMGLNVASRQSIQPDDRHLHRQFDAETCRWSVPYTYASLSFLLDLTIAGLKRVSITIASSFLTAVVRACVQQQFQVDKVKNLLTALKGKGFHIQINLDDLTEDCEPLKVKRRVDSVKYHVGTIMHHRMYNYHGVISGWDEKCEMPMEWVVQMGVDQLNGGHLQPFYNVLVEDHTTRYVAQENILIPKDPHPILHFSAGKYFAAYKGDHYQPNRVLRRAYPEDQYCAGQP